MSILSISDIVEKIQKGYTLNEMENQMAETPLYILDGYKTPEDHVQAIRNKNRVNFL